jgi:hypothetical protein
VLGLSFCATAVSAAFGDTLRQRVHPRVGEGNDFGFAINATLTLLAVIVGFTFSMAVSRYDLRKTFEQAEANAIGTEYTRANLLHPDDAAKVRALLKVYLDARLSFYTTRDPNRIAKISAATTHLQDELWSAAQTGVATIPPPVMGLVLSGMNDISNAQRSSQGAWQNRIPRGAWVLMAIIALACSFLSCFRAHRSDWLAFLIVPFAVSVSFFLIADIDSSTGGVIRLVPQNLQSLSQSLSKV